MRVALCDDSALFRRGLALLLADAGVTVTAEASEATGLVRLLENDPPDVTVLDIRMPPTFTDEGLAAAAGLRAALPRMGILVLSTYAETAYAVRLLETAPHGVGYLLKDRVDDIGTLRDALDRIAAGGTVVDPGLVARLMRRHREQHALDRLTPREREVLSLMAEGRSNAAIGRQLYLGAKTVEGHIAAVMGKLGLAPTSSDNRRVLAVLTFLRATSPPLADPTAE